MGATNQSSDAVSANPSRAVRLFHNPVTAWLILLCGFAATGAAWYISDSSLQARSSERFERRSAELTGAIGDRLRVYEQVLWGGVALFEATGALPSRPEFKRYVAALDLDKHWPGIQGIGFAPYVSSADKDSYLKKVQDEGFTDFAVKPQGDRAAYGPVTYLEPFDWRNKRAFGYDMYSNDMRRFAMDRARDTGEATMSGLITLVQETSTNTQRGFLTYVPVYQPGPTETVDQRRKRFIGWVYSPFRVEDLMAGILGSGDQSRSGHDIVDYEIYDGPISKETLLFDNNEEVVGQGTPEGTDFDRTQEVELVGRKWTVRFTSHPGFVSDAESRQPMIIMAVGLTIDFLLFYVISSLSLLNNRARNMAERMTAELNRTHQELETRAAALELRTTELDKTNRELERFATVAAHDLQEPIRTVHGFVEALRQDLDGTLSDESKEYMTFITDAATHMRKLVSGLLDYARAKVVANVEPTDQNVCVQAAMQRLAIAIADSNATLTVGALPTVLCDRDRWPQVYENLIGNALKYRSKADPVISIEEVECDREGFVEVVVRDNGVGVPPGKETAIFEIFTRMHHQSDVPGTGVGLAICKQVVEANGGYMTAENNPGDEPGLTIGIQMPDWKERT